jgi:helix-turn-helix protein
LVYCYNQPFRLYDFSKAKEFLMFAVDKDFHFKLTNEIFNRKKLLIAYKNHFAKLFGISKPAEVMVFQKHELLVASPTVMRLKNPHAIVFK